MATKAMVESNEDSLSGRTRESVTGWWGRSRRFLSEVRNEMGRVTWPSKKEVYATTLVVILTSDAHAHDLAARIGIIQAVVATHRHPHLRHP